MEHSRYVCERLAESVVQVGVFFSKPHRRPTQFALHAFLSPTGTPSLAHLRVLVRTQPGELLLLRSLIYNLRAQSEAHEWMQVDFVLVPTEPGNQLVYEKLHKGKRIDKHASCGRKGR